MKVVEIFDSIQGDGTFIGTPATFIRLYGCNLRFVWCDTKYAMEDDWTDMNAEEIADRVTKFHVVITGGEPLIHDLSELIRKLVVDHFIQIETNCTINPFEASDFLERLAYRNVDWWTVSPKLQSSHQWYNKDTLLEFNTLKNVEFKFVIKDRKDFVQAMSLTKDYGLKNVVLQPCYTGEDPLKLLKTLISWVHEWSVEDLLEVRVLPQLHRILWGDQRGV